MAIEDKRLYRPSRLKEVLNNFGFTFTKSLGQNFLIDGNIVRKISEGAELTKEDYVLEIGTGIGTLTEELAIKAGKVLAIEIDRSLEPILNYTLKEFDNVDIIFQDVLKVDLKKIIEEKFGDKKFKVVANLPYYVTTPIISMLIESDLNIDSITVMVQKEVAKRMNAKPHTKDYGSFSVFIQHYTTPSLVVNVPNSVFIPKPKVDSIVINLKVKEKELGIDEDKLFKIVKAAFSKRRKTLINALSSFGFQVEKNDIRRALEISGINEMIRAEDLSLEEYKVLSINFPKIWGGTWKNVYWIVKK